ncbi:MAG: DUF438 domain-containing protein [Candidatus Aminicenantes bacterium]
MELHEKVKINDLLKKYPELLDFLVNKWPTFKKLKNPVLRKTIGKLATISQAAAMASINTATLLTEIAGEIERQTGQRPNILHGEDMAAVESFKDNAAREETLKDIIRDLHAGKDMDELKNRFQALIEDVEPSEIAQMEQKLIQEGMPEDEVKRLCDVHVKIFEESLEKHELPGAAPGHPVHTFMKENRKAEEIIQDLKKIVKEKNDISLLSKKFPELEKINFHYLRKENQLFPLLEKKGVSGPSSVMWAIHDDIRTQFKSVQALLTDSPDIQNIETELNALIKLIADMIYKEERILFPMALETLSKDEWIKVKKGEEEIGFSWVEPDPGWEPGIKRETKTAPVEKNQGLDLQTGTLSLEQVNLMVNHLPVEISFVDENDEVRFYSHSKGHRIFPRSPGVIGRKVQNCHPGKSVHMVQSILEAFRSGEKDAADFWITLNGRFILIRYFAVRDEKGNYKGTLEVTQDITDVRELRGEKRLLDWE